MSQDFAFHQIGVVHSCFHGKFGIPRQPGLVQEARGTIEFLPPYNQENLVRGLEQFSHIWVLFVFHLSMREHWKGTVRPPRLGGDTRIGVMATRSPFRPNPIGLSVVKLEGIEKRPSHLSLAVTGLDILDGSPVLDVKPYLPYADALANAQGGFAATAPDTSALQVRFADECLGALEFQETRHPGYRALAVKLLAGDPRPAYQDLPEKEYDLFLYDTEIAFRCKEGVATVFRISSLT